MALGKGERREKYRRRSRKRTPPQLSVIGVVDGGVKIGKERGRKGREWEGKGKGWGRGGEGKGREWKRRKGRGDKH